MSEGDCMAKSSSHSGVFFIQNAKYERQCFSRKNEFITKRRLYSSTWLNMKVRLWLTMIDNCLALSLSL